MSQAHSISTHRRYGMARVCDVWGVSRATVYRQRAPGNAANAAGAPRRRGPQGACSDTELLGHIDAVIEASPFSGEGYPEECRRNCGRTAFVRLPAACVGS